jgi:hypothetical protein
MRRYTLIAVGCIVLAALLLWLLMPRADAPVAPESEPKAAVAIRPEPQPSSPATQAPDVVPAPAVPEAEPTDSPAAEQPVASGWWELTGRALFGGAPVPFVQLTFGARGMTEAAYVTLHTSEDGHFTAEFEWRGGSHGLPQDARWYCGRAIHLHRNDWQAHQPLPRPSLAGRTLDFGDVVLHGGMVELHVEAGDGANLDAGTLSFYLTSGSLSLSERTPAPVSVSRMLTPPGRWKYDIAWLAEELHYMPSRGVIDVGEGEVKVLRYVATPFPTALVFVETPHGPAWNATITRLRDGDGDMGSYPASEQPVAVQLLDGAVALSASMDGWASKKIPLPQPGQTVRILLDEPVEVESKPPDTLLRVVLPGSDWLEGNTVFLRLSGTREITERATVAAVESVVEIQMPHEPVWELSVYGGLLFGFPEGLISGPHSIGITPHMENEWRLPGWPEPPSRTPALGLPLVKCGGRPVRGRLPARYESGSQELLQVGRAGIAGTETPVALVDSGTEIPFSLQRTDDSGERLVLDLPVRVSIRLHDEAAPGRWLAFGWGGEDYSNGSVTVDFTQGEAWLWLPRGEALISVMRDTVEVCQWRITISGDATQILVVDEAMGAVQLDVEWPQGVPASAWYFEAVKTGETAGEALEPGKTTHLKPGQYTLVPPHDVIADAMNFTVVDGETTTVRVRVQAAVPMDGSLILPRPEEGTVESASFYWVIDNHPEKFFENGRLHAAGMQISAREVPEGVLLNGLPRGRELWIYGGVRIGDKAFALAPRKTTVGEARITLECQWLKLVWLTQRQWNMFPFTMWWETPAGPRVLCQVLGGGLIALPTGPARVTIRNWQGEVVAEHSLNLQPGEEEVPIPPELKQRLRQLGIVE